MSGRRRAARTAATTAGLLGLLATALVAAPTTSAAATERVVIGSSVQGRPIVAVHRWRPGATRSAVVIGSMHGDERAGLRVVRRLGQATLPAGLDLWLIRTMNPDGTTADRRTNARGVDLNRNFPRFWVRGGAGTSTWSGPRPASEPETRVVMRFLHDVQPRTTLVFHQPLYGVDSYRAKSMRLVRRLAAASGLPVKSFDCYGGCRGTLTDWHNARTPGRAVTIELGHVAARDQVRRTAGGVLRVLAPAA